MELFHEGMFRPFRTKHTLHQTDLIDRKRFNLDRMVDIPRPGIARKTTERQMGREAISGIASHMAGQSSGQPTLNFQQGRRRIRLTADQPRPSTSRKSSQTAQSQFKPLKTGNRSGHGLLHLLKIANRCRTDELEREMDLLNGRRFVICCFELP